MIFKLLFAVVVMMISSSNSLTIREPATNTSTYVHSPRIFIGEFQPVINLTIHFAKNHGCNKNDFKPYNGSSEVWITHEGYCPIQHIIKAARSSQVKQLVIVWTANGEPGYNAKIGAIGISFSDIQVFQVTKDDGKLFKEGLLIDFLHDDENEWNEFWNSTGLVVWQLTLGLLFLSILGVAIVKLRLLNRKWVDARKFRIPSFSLVLTSISCIICLLYILVDPMQSRGIYCRPMYLILLTLYLPCTITTSLFMTWSLLQTFTAKNVTTIGGKLEKALMVFRVLSVLAILFDLLLSSLRGFIYNPELSYIAALPTVFYCISATFMIVLYFYLVFKVVHKQSGGTNNIFKNIRRFQEKNLWLFSFCYIAWMVSVISATVYFDSASKRTPGIVSVVYFFAYFCVGMINLFHVFIIKVPKPAVAPSYIHLNTLGIHFGAVLSSQESTVNTSSVSDVPANTKT